MTGWPFPLDAIQGWFEGLWNGVNTWINNAVSWVRDRVLEGLDWLKTQVWDRIASAVSGAVTTLGSWLDGVRDKVWGFITWLRDRITEGLSWAWTQISSGLGSLWTTISGALTTARDWIVNNVGAALSTARTALTGLLGSLSTALTGARDWIVGKVQGGFSSLSSALSATGSWIGDRLKDGWNTLTTALTTAVGTIAGYVQDALAGVANALGGALQGFFSWLRDQLSGLMTWLVNGIQALGNAIAGVFRGIGNAILAPITEALKPGSPDKETEKTTAEFATTLLGKIVKDIEQVKGSPADPSKAIAAGAAVLAGITLMQSVGHVLTMAFDATHPAKKWGTQEMFQRIVLTLFSSPVTSGILAVPVTIGILTPMRQAFNKMYTPELPGVQDLLSFYSRKIIDSETYMETMAYQGFSPQWAEAYEAAHAIVPAIDQVQDAFHRGIIDENERDRYLAFREVSSVARPGIAKSDLVILSGLAKTLIPRVDLRSAWELGFITDDELVERFRAQGYEDDSELMAGIHMTRALADEITKVRGEWITDFVDGYVDEDTLRANLSEMGIIGVRQDYYIAYATRKREREYRKDLLAVYLDAYLKDLATDEELESRAREILVDENAISVYLDSAHVKKYKKPSPPKPEKIKEGSLAYLTTAYREGLIDESALRSELTSRKYDPADIDLIVRVENLKIAEALERAAKTRAA